MAMGAISLEDVCVSYSERRTYTENGFYILEIMVRCAVAIVCMWNLEEWRCDNIAI